MAGVLVISGGDYTPALLVLAAPGVGVLALLIWLRARVPDPAGYEPPPTADIADPERSSAPHTPPVNLTRLPRAFWIYAAFTAATTLGFATFGVLSFHLVAQNLLPAAGVPVLYAAAMGVEAVAALAVGWWFDRHGPITIAVLPILSAGIPILAFADTTTMAVAGCLLWGAAVGVQESTLKATVAELVPPGRRATAYGIYAGVIGAATLIGATLTGALYTYSIPALVITVAAIQTAALILLIATRPTRSPRL